MYATRHRGAVHLLALFWAGSPSLHAAVTFNFNPAPGMSATAIAGFQEAADLWSAQLFDNMVVNLNIDFKALGAGIIGGASPTDINLPYATVRAAMVNDAQSTDDLSAVANLPGGSTFDLYINRTSDSPNGSGNATPYVDANGSANNSTINLSTANAKALKLINPYDAVTDASIEFSSSFTYDFDRSNGISGGTIDFVGVAAHEIGHALGFFSGVDFLDYFSQASQGGPYAEDDFTYVTPLDLFRYSAVSAGLGVIDWTANNTDKFLSIDGGATLLTQFAEGSIYGDGRQASHWKDNQTLGIMDPTLANGELAIIRANDIRVFDLIGYDLTATQVAPEPSTLLMALLGILGLRLSRNQLASSRKIKVRIFRAHLRRRAW